MADVVERVRIDRWLWAVRLFKTRTQAVHACKSGHVRIEDERVKPSRSAQVGEVIHIEKETSSHIVRVKALLEKRVGAKLVSDFLEDLTPPELIGQKTQTLAQALLKRDRGTGRPTKKERRDIDSLLEESEVSSGN